MVDRRGERLIVAHGGAQRPEAIARLPFARLEQAGSALADCTWPDASLAVFEAARRNGVPSVLDAEEHESANLLTLARAADLPIFSKGAARVLCGAATTPDRRPRASHARRFRRHARRARLAVADRRSDPRDSRTRRRLGRHDRRRRRFPRSGRGGPRRAHAAPRGRAFRQRLRWPQMCALKRLGRHTDAPADGRGVAEALLAAVTTTNAIASARRCRRRTCGFP
jgi:hypothetical protein